MAMRALRYSLFAALVACSFFASVVVASTQGAANVFEKLNNEVAGALDQFRLAENEADKRKHLARAVATLGKMRDLVKPAENGQDVGISADELKTYIAAVEKDIARISDGLVTVKADGKSKTAAMRPGKAPWSIDDLKPFFDRDGRQKFHQDRIVADLKAVDATNNWAKRELAKLQADREAYLFEHFKVFNRQLIRLMADIIRDAGGRKDDKTAYNRAIQLAKAKVVRNLKRRDHSYTYSANIGRGLNAEETKNVKQLAGAIRGDRDAGPILAAIEKRLAAMANPPTNPRGGSSLDRRAGLLAVARSKPLNFVEAKTRYEALQREYRTLLISGPGNAAKARTYWSRTKSREWVAKRNAVCQKIVALERQIVWTIGAPKPTREQDGDNKLLAAVSAEIRKRHTWQQTDHVNALRQLFANAFPILLKAGTSVDAGGSAQSGLDLQVFSETYADPARASSLREIAAADKALDAYLAARLSRGLERALASRAFQPREHREIAPASFSASAYHPLGYRAWVKFHNRGTRILGSCQNAASGYGELMTATELGHFQRQDAARALHLSRNIDRD